MNFTWFNQQTLRQVIGLVPVQKIKRWGRTGAAARSRSGRLMQSVSVRSVFSARVCFPSSSILPAAASNDSCLARCLHSWQVSLRAEQTLASAERRGEGGQLYPLSSFAACSRALSEAAEPSNRCEAMAAWWDMLFLTTSPFLHSVISYKSQEQKVRGFVLCMSAWGEKLQV